MAIRSIDTEQARDMLVKFITGKKLPFTAEINDGKHRSTDQNRLQRQWMNDIASQLGESSEHWRGYCKLHFGVAIRKAASEAYALSYDETMRPLPYEVKLALMREPHNMPVTRDMTVKQMTEYLNTIQRHFSEQGVVLTDPDGLMFQNDRRAA